MKKGKEHKPHIGIFGRRNFGKSSFINAVTDQDLAIVSEIPGTTTDPVKKSIEITGLGPAVLIDTAGIDDIGELGTKRIEKSLKTISQIDLAIIVINDNLWDKEEIDLIDKLEDFEVPFFIVHNKSDLARIKNELKTELEEKYNTVVVEFSSIEPEINTIIEAINKCLPDSSYKINQLVGDIISKNDYVVLITPVDSEAPEGRMILPQQQLIRDVIDHDAIAIVLRENEADYFFKTSPITPRLVIIDSQIFELASKMVPKHIPMTSFSIVLARQKGDFETYKKGTPKISELKDGDRVLILESCTHQVTCDDIGRVKIPMWLKKFTNKELEFDMVSGLGSLPREISEYSLVVQCGGCVITAKQIKGRLNTAKKANIPITNYGMCIAYCKGIYNEAIKPFAKEKGES